MGAAGDRAGAAGTSGAARPVAVGTGVAGEAEPVAKTEDRMAKGRTAGRDAAPGLRAKDRAEQTAKVDSRRAAKADAAAEESGSSAYAAAGAARDAIARTAKASQKSSDPDSAKAIETTEKPEKQKGSEASVSVLDLRRGVEARRGDTAKRVAATTAEDGAADAKREQSSGRNEVVKTLEAGPGFGASASDKASGAASGGAGPAAAQPAGEGPADFRALLAERLQESWNGEIVKSAHIVLRDGDSGTIRLRLKPESLGNVKIELNLSDNNISGKIVVESDEAKTAFERNMAELADAFRAGGFDSARLEVSVGSGSGGGAAKDEGGSGPFYSERLRSASASSAQPATAQAAYARSGGSVDIFA